MTRSSPGSTLSSSAGCPTPATSSAATPTFSTRCGRYRDRIRYLHLKDVDAAGTWAMLGEGACDVPAVIDIVAAAPRFNGWLVLEEESDAAAADPAAAVRRNFETMQRLGFTTPS